MTAAWMWARAELRTRWKAWILLGLLAGVTVGVAAAGVAGARRTVRAVPDFVAAAHLPTAAVLANDPAFGPAARARVAALPGVRQTFPFLVGVATQVYRPPGLGDASAALFPASTASMRLLGGPLVEGRSPDPTRADEVVVDENARDRFHLGIGATMVVGQSTAAEGEVPPEFAAPDGVQPFRQRMRVVGIGKSVSSDPSWTPSSGFYAKYGAHMPQLVNIFADLHGGSAAIPRFGDRVAKILGHPVNVEDANDLFGIRKATNVTGFERDGLLIFALAALLGGGVLVGQALVRAVSASAADLPTWRAIGADRPLAVRALVLPAFVTATVAPLTTIVVAVSLSGQFPLGTARDYDLHLGPHVDALIVGLAGLGAFVGVLSIATLAAWWRVTRRDRPEVAPSAVERLAAPMSGAPALMIGARLAGEPGRGRRAVPVRSALIGAIAGVLGVVACLTFRAGIHDAIAQPRRSGVVWDFGVAAGGGAIPHRTVRAIAHDPDVGDALQASWHRAVPIDGRPVPVFGTRALHGDIPFVVLDGRRPRGADELVLAPTTLKELRLSIGDRVRIGSGDGSLVRVVGVALLPATSHTDYDQSGWMTQAGMARATSPTGRDLAAEDYVLVRWRAGTDAEAAQRRLARIGGNDLFPIPATLPAAVVDLGRIEDLPVALALFFGLLACATVAHALVTTVRRRRRDLAVLRSMGFTRRQTRLAITWQATLLALVGIIVGVPLGVAAGRFAWRWLADDFPLAYVPPLAWVAIGAVAVIAVALANLLAAGPAHVATRIRPAETLRTE